MGYTHYLERKGKDLTDQQKSIINTFYKEVLKLIQVTPTKNLYEVAMEGYKADYDTPEYQIFDECFHEWQHQVNEPHEPVIFGQDDQFNFTKTARKLYDLPIVLAYTLASYTGAYNFSSDGDVSMFSLESPNSITYDIETYCKNELEDSMLVKYNGNMPAIVGLFYETGAALADVMGITINRAASSTTTQSTHKYSVGEEVTYLGSIFKIERLESNKRYKLKNVRGYVKETELNTQAIDEGHEDYTTFISLKELDREDLEFIKTNLAQGKSQIILPNGYLFQINLLSKS